MNVLDNILLLLGEIKGELVELRKLHERVARLEMWQWWMRGGAFVAYVLILKFALAH